MSRVERVEFTSSCFKSSSHDIHIGELESFSCTRTGIRLQVDSIPTELPLATIFVVSVKHLELKVDCNILFQLLSIGAMVTYGSTNKVLSDANISVTKKKWGHWEVSFTPVCGGVHNLAIFMTNKERNTHNWTFKVIGRPWTNVCVTNGPDFREPKPPAENSSSSDEQSEKNIRTFSLLLF